MWVIGPVSKDILCGGWQDFSNELDDVIPLASLFSEENTQTGFPEIQPVGLPPACREFLTEGPLEQSYEVVGLGES